MPQMFHLVIAMDGGRKRTKFGKQAEQKICCTANEGSSAGIIKRQHALVLRTARPTFNKITRLYQTGRTKRNSESRPSRKFAVTSEKHSERRQQRGYYIVRDNTRWCFERHGLHPTKSQDFIKPEDDRPRSSVEKAGS